MRLSRRQLLRSAVAAVVASPAAARVFDSPSLAQTAQRPTTLPTRVLGRTGERISMLGFSGEHALRAAESERRADAVVNAALEHGITYFDTAREYDDAEYHLGRALAGRRDRVFLATKVDARPYDKAWRSIENSLRNLRTDRVDLLQIHHVQDLQDADRVTADNGSLRAVTEAREQGLTRYLGVTGHHDPEPLAEMLRRFDFDTLMMPMNAADLHYLPFQGPVLQEALGRGMGVINIKVLGRGALISGEGALTIPQAVGYALSLPVTAAVIGVAHAGELPRLVQAVREFKRLSAAEMVAVAEQARPFARSANFFKRGSGAPWPA